MRPLSNSYIRGVSLLSCAVIALSFVVGCQRTSQTSEPTSTSNGKPGFIFTVTPADGYLVSKVDRLMDANGGHSERHSQWIYFYSGAGSPVAANAVALNTQSLTVGVGVQAGIRTVSYDGANHIWSVTGNTNVPTYSDTVVSPTRFTITEPDAGVDSISKGSGVTVQYTSPGTDSVFITLAYENGASRRRDSTTTITAWIKSYWVANTGSYTVPSSAFNTLAPNTGIVSIAVIAFKKKEKTLSGKRLVAYSAVSTTSYHDLKQ